MRLCARKSAHLSPPLSIFQSFFHPVPTSTYAHFTPEHVRLCARNSASRPLAAFRRPVGAEAAAVGSRTDAGESLVDAIKLFIGACGPFGPAIDSFAPASDSLGPANDSFPPANDSLGHANDSFAPANDSSGHANDSLAPANGVLGRSDVKLRRVCGRMLGSSGETEVYCSTGTWGAAIRFASRAHGRLLAIATQPYTSACTASRTSTLSTKTACSSRMSP